MSYEIKTTGSSLRGMICIPLFFIYTLATWTSASPSGERIRGEKGGRDLQRTGGSLSCHPKPAASVLFYRAIGSDLQMQEKKKRGLP